MSTTIQLGPSDTDWTPPAGCISPVLFGCLGAGDAGDVEGPGYGGGAGEYREDSVAITPGVPITVTIDVAGGQGSTYVGDGSIVKGFSAVGKNPGSGGNGATSRPGKTGGAPSTNPGDVFNGGSGAGAPGPGGDGADGSDADGSMSSHAPGGVGDSGTGGQGGSADLDPDGGGATGFGSGGGGAAGGGTPGGASDGRIWVTYDVSVPSVDSWQPCIAQPLHLPAQLIAA